MKNCVFGIMFCAACSMIGEACAENKTVSLVKRGGPSPEATSSFNQDLKAKIQAVLTIEGMEPARIVFFDSDGNYADAYKRTATYTVKALEGTLSKLTVKISGTTSLTREKDEAGVALTTPDTTIINTEFFWIFKGNTQKGTVDTAVTFEGVAKNDVISVTFDIPEQERKNMNGGEYEGQAKFEIVAVG